MAIGVRCPECGRQYDLQDSLAGSKLQCVDCRTAIQVPGAPPMLKVCAVCKADIAKVPRFKDEAGYYYCGGCWGELEAVLAALPPEARALRLEILRQRMEEAHRPAAVPYRRQPTELVKLVHSVFSTKPTLKQKLIILGAVLLATILSYFLPAAATTTWATFMVLGVFIVIFSAIWTFGPPFLDGFQVGMNCLMSTRERRLWQEKNADYRLRWPRATPLLGIGLLALSWGYYQLAQWRTKPPAEALSQVETNRPAPPPAPVTQP